MNVAPADTDRAGWLSEIAARRTGFLAAIERRNCDATLVYGSAGLAERLQYLTGFAPLFDGWAILRRDGELSGVLRFAFEVDEAIERSGTTAWTGSPEPLDEVIAQLRRASLGRLAIVPWDQISANAVTRLRDELPGVALVDATAALDAMRRIKSAREIAVLREAVRITDEALDAIRCELVPGVTEHEVSARLSFLVQRQGGACPLPPFVLGGNDRPVIVRTPSKRPLRLGDTVMIDMVVAFDGYQSDVSRTMVVGEPSPLQRSRWATVLEAHRAALECAVPGTPCRELHAAAAAVLEAAGHPLPHRVGHGIGLATSLEWPSLDTDATPLAPGMTICVEPAVYAPGTGSLKLEDDLVITEDGYKLLSRAESQL